MPPATPHTISDEPRKRGLSALLVLVVVVLCAIGSAFAQEPPAPSPPSPPKAQPAPAPAPPAEEAPPTTGFAPLPGNAQVPLKWLPPGAFEQDRGPSPAIFPPQKLTLRFNHKFHVITQRLKCESC